VSFNKCHSTNVFSDKSKTLSTNAIQQMFLSNKSKTLAHVSLSLERQMESFIRGTWLTSMCGHMRIRARLWIIWKYLRAGPPDMPLRNWYNCGTNHFHQTSVVWGKWKTQPDWVIKAVTHDLVRRIRFLRMKISGTWF